VYSIVMDLDEGKFGIAKGQPCGNEYESVRLTNLYAREEALS
jgi:hypothetical protein